MPMPLELQKTEAVKLARQSFFEEGTLPGGLVHDAVWRSWQRCAGHGRHVGEAVVFNQVRRSALDELRERNRQLIVASEPAIRHLAQTVSGAGYGIVLTDATGVCVAVHGPVANCGSSMRQALRQGVDLSERAVGTNAMGAAMAEAMPIAICGGEHFFAQNQSFQCLAAPIFHPDGSLAGAIDISRDTPGPDLGGLPMMLDTAAAIESALLLRMPAHVTLGLHWRADAGERFKHALLAFGDDGRVLASSSGARRLLGLGGGPAGLHCRDLFRDDYAPLLRTLAAARLPVPLTLQSGLLIFVRAYSFRRSPGVPARRPARPAEPDTPPEFGDQGVHLALRQAVRALNANLPVMIRGETGTGKEVAARALHARSTACDGPFVAINCGAIPRELIEGELFGYADGAYTGARRGGAKGRIEEAHGGTLFLDEIGDMPLDLQTRLLRVLENREVTRLGESVARKLSIQLLSATHQDLDALVGQQRFRSDLHFRLGGMLLALPPLRQRSHLGALIDALLAEEGIDARRLTAQARTALEQHRWPGNTRELRTALRFARAMADEDEPILRSHLPDTVTRAAPPPRPSLPGATMAGRAKPLKELERDSIDSALAEAAGNITSAARQLGISRSTLHRRLKYATLDAP